jgi:hypothetical protein
MERDGITPIRSDDKFFGNAPATCSPTGSTRQGRDPAGRRAAAPAREPDHADELAKEAAAALLVLPDGKKAVVVMTGDDHGNGGTVGRFDQFKAASPAGCSLANWECVRATSYIYPTRRDAAQALHIEADGFEVGVHVTPAAPTTAWPA